MTKLVMKPMVIRKKIMPLVMVVANKIINELGLVKKINETVRWDKERWEISPGGLAKAVVLSTFFDMRAPLTQLQDRFENIDIGYFIGERGEFCDINAFNTGRALERIGKADHSGIYETLALSAIQMYKIPVSRLHSDTTTVSFYGEYDVDTTKLSEEEREELLEIEKGYNKDGRRGCKQVVMGQVVNETGIPLVSRTMNGSTSDVEWNKKAIQHLNTIRESGFKSGIYVADSKLVTEELIREMTNPDSRIGFVSRCPANFDRKLESRMINRAYEADNWEELGRFHEGKNASEYKGISFIETVCGYPMRLLVLHSSTLSQKAEQRLKKAEEEIKPLIREMEKKEFACLADAEAELKRFRESRKTSMFECAVSIEEKTREVWPRGRRGAKTQPKTVRTYQVHVTDVSRNEESLRFVRNESCFVIISNVVEGVDNRDLLGIYKGQQVVENSFRLLKQPQLASVIYLKNPIRVEALSMLLSFSLLIRAIIQYRMREGLIKFKEENPGVKLHIGWNGRPLESPTFKLFFEHSIHCYFEKESSWQYSFAWPNVETRERVSGLLKLMDIDLEYLIQ